MVILVEMETSIPFSVCDVCLVFFDEEGRQRERVLERNIDLDYCNIRHWRTFLSELEKENNVHLANLVIKPKYASNTLL